MTEIYIRLLQGSTIPHRCIESTQKIIGRFIISQKIYSKWSLPQKKLMKFAFGFYLFAVRLIIISLLLLLSVSQILKISPLPRQVCLSDFISKTHRKFNSLWYLRRKKYRLSTSGLLLPVTIHIICGSMENLLLTQLQRSNGILSVVSTNNII